MLTRVYKRRLISIRVYKRLLSKTGSEQPNMIGQRFERLLVLSYNAEMSKFGHYDYYQVRCDCGEERVVKGSSLQNGHT